MQINHEEFVCALSFKRFVYQQQSLAAQESPGGFSFTSQELNTAISWR